MDRTDATGSSEPDLILRARRGDEVAWEELVRAHEQAVFRLAYLLLHDADDAADVAQETFMRAVRSLGGFDAERSLRPWLLAITANVARNHRRSVGRYIAVLRRWVQSETVPVTSLGEQSGPAWEATLLWQAVRKLAQVDQEVLYLRYFLDLNEAEMAESLGIAAGTVKSRLHRAMARLRTVVDGEFPALREERLV